MASITLLVEIEDLENERLSGMEDRVYEVLCKTFPGTVIDVTEEDRTEDEDDDVA